MPRKKKSGPTKVEMVKAALGSGTDKGSNVDLANWINAKYGANTINPATVASYKSKMGSKNGSSAKSAPAKASKGIVRKGIGRTANEDAFTLRQFQAAQVLVDELGHDRAVALVKAIFAVLTPMALMGL